ncbi:MAG TPA: hypothetical protein VGE37_09865, partial [Archangium sp.]
MGFALVTVLCAVLMTLSVARGWGLDLFHPGRPIAASGQADAAPHARPRAVPTTDPAPVSIPTELSTQPLGAAVGAEAHRVKVVHAIGRSVGSAKATKSTESTEST